MRRTPLAAVLLLLALAACARGAVTPIALDGSPRVPDDEGVATTLTHERIVLDGERTYDVSPALRSFSALTLDIEPMLSREGQYVQVGIEGDEIVWMGGVAAVVTAIQPPSAYFTGTVESIRDGRVTFTNGTVFRLADGVRPETRTGRVAVQIDVRRHAVIAVKSQASR